MKCLICEKIINRRNRKYNLITLCKSCHSKTNFKREYYKNYFQLLIEKIYEHET